MPTTQQAQTALDLIEADPSKILVLDVGSHTHVKPGQYIPKADAQSEPTLSFPGLSPSATYLVVSLDLDAPFPSFGVLGPVLHWIQPGFRVGSDAALTAEAPFVCNYIGPAPPPPSSPHRYAFFLYEQPAGFDGAKYAPAGGKEVGVWGRVRYDLDSWAREIGLGPVLACNYFKSN